VKTTLTCFNIWLSPKGKETHGTKSFLGEPRLERYQVVVILGWTSSSLSPRYSRPLVSAGVWFQEDRH
jgi:hypothetical protein